MFATVLPRVARQALLTLTVLVLLAVYATGLAHAKALDATHASGPNVTQLNSAVCGQAEPIGYNFATEICTDSIAYFASVTQTGSSPQAQEQLEYKLFGAAGASEPGQIVTAATVDDGDAWIADPNLRSMVRGGATIGATAQVSVEPEWVSNPLVFKLQVLHGIGTN